MKYIMMAIALAVYCILLLVYAGCEQTGTVACNGPEDCGSCQTCQDGRCVADSNCQEDGGIPDADGESEPQYAEEQQTLEESQTLEEQQYEEDDNQPTFIIYNSWDFEDEEVDQYTDTEITEDFIYTKLFSHNAANIEVDTINGVPTKVMRITHEANKTDVGFEMNVDLGVDYLELYLSYNWKFSEEFNSTTGGKMSGLGGLPDFGSYCPVAGDGFRVHNNFKQANRLTSYHYDRTEHGYPECPWAIEDYDFNSIYFNNGSWYNITQRLVVNSFDNGVANADGIKELWVDGRLIFQKANLKLMQDESADMLIDAFRLTNFYGGSGVEAQPLYECYGYIDNIKVYMPNDDPVSLDQLHSPSTILTTPDEVTDRSVYYDTLITLPVTLSNTDFGGTYGSCIDEAYLIDAGPNNTVSYNLASYVLGGGDYLFFYDGNQTDSSLLEMLQQGSGSNLTIKSSERYLFIRFSTNQDVGTTGWTGTITFN